MKMISIATILAVGFLAGCATSFPQGILYTELKLPVSSTGIGGKSPKIGTAQCMSFLGMVATGDCSIDTAMKQGGITKIHHVDWDSKNVLGFLGEYKLVVYGE